MGKFQFQELFIQKYAEDEKFYKILNDVLAMLFSMETVLNIILS